MRWLNWRGESHRTVGRTTNTTTDAHPPSAGAAATEGARRYLPGALSAPSASLMPALLKRDVRSNSLVRCHDSNGRGWQVKC